MPPSPARTNRRSSLGREQQQSKLNHNDEGIWSTEIVQEFGAEIGGEYLLRFQQECLTVRQISQLRPDELRELGIRMGHRQRLHDLADEVVAVVAKRLAADERRRRRDRLLRAESSGPQGPLAKMALQQSLEATLKFTSSWRAPQGQMGSTTSPDLSVATFRNREEVEWVSMTGSAVTLPDFLTETYGLLTSLGFPAATFHRAFYDNKPMPFVEFAESPTGGPQAAILLRIPDLSADDGISVTVITNRIVVLLSMDENMVVTYQRHPPADDSLGKSVPFRDEWRNGVYDLCDMGEILEAMLSRYIRAYETATSLLRESMDAAMHKADEEGTAVKKLSFVMKKASVFQRCATASRDTLEEIIRNPAYEDLHRNMKVLCDRLKTVALLCEEMEESALTSIDLNIALADFRTNRNMKLFTYVTIVAQPISMATGWYGMNFVIPEYDNEHAYPIFASVVLFCAIALLGLILWREKKLSLQKVVSMPLMPFEEIRQRVAALREKNNRVPNRQAPPLTTAAMCSELSLLPAPQATLAPSPDPDGDVGGEAESGVTPQRRRSHPKCDVYASSAKVTDWLSNVGDNHPEDSVM